LLTFARAVERHGLPHLEFSRNALRAAESADWPGNVRQLAHAVEAAAIRGAGEEATQVERHHLFADGDNFDGEPNGVLTFQQATRRFHMQLLEQTLAETDWNVAEAARRLDVTRSYMYKLIRGVGLERQRG
jgi:Nif-specific regulatory protein